MTVTRCCPQMVHRAHEDWCPVHGTISDALPDVGAVEEPGPVRRRDLAARTGDAWSADDEAFVLAHIDDMSAAEMGAVIGRTERAIHHWLSKRHLRKARVTRSSAMAEPAGPEPSAPPSFGRYTRWSDHELAVLEDTPPPQLMSRLSHYLPGRSVDAARKRLARLVGDWPRRGSDGMLTARDVARVHGCHPMQVTRLIERGELSAERAPWGDWRIEPSAGESAGHLLRRRRRGEGGSKS